MVPEGFTLTSGIIDPFNTPLTVPTTVHEPDFHYYTYDHLGNTRIVYSTTIPSCGTPKYTLEAVMDYFPYGKILRQFIKTPEKYVTTGHQRDVETGLDYRGARFYDSDVARFLSLDPLAAEFAEWSAYNYVLGNPVMLVDPDGKAPDWIPSMNDKGEIILTAEKGDNVKTLIKFFGNEEAASKYVKQKALDENTSYKEGDKVKFNSNNIFSKTTAYYKKNEKEILNNQAYDCKELAVSLIIHNVPLMKKTPNSEAENKELSYDFGKYSEEIATEERQFGEAYSYWSFGEGFFRGGDHAMVYFGKSKNGTTYYLSKNGVGGELMIGTKAQVKKQSGYRLLDMAFSGHFKFTFK